MVIADCWLELGLQNDGLFFIVSLAFEKLVKKNVFKILEATSTCVDTEGDDTVEREVQRR